MKLTLVLVVLGLCWGCAEDVATIEEAQVFEVCDGQPPGGELMCSAGCQSDAVASEGGCLISYAPKEWRGMGCPFYLAVEWRGLEGCCLPEEDGWRFYACVP